MLIIELVLRCTDHVPGYVLSDLYQLCKPHKSQGVSAADNPQLTGKGLRLGES